MDRASDSGSEGWGFESLPVYQKKQKPGWVSAFLVHWEEGTRTIPCGADERRRRRLDGAEPQFSPTIVGENANESLPVFQKIGLERAAPVTHTKYLHKEIVLQNRRVIP